MLLLIHKYFCYWVQLTNNNSRQHSIKIRTLYPSPYHVDHSAQQHFPDQTNYLNSLFAYLYKLVYSLTDILEKEEKTQPKLTAMTQYSELCPPAFLPPHTNTSPFFLQMTKCMQGIWEKKQIIHHTLISRKWKTHNSHWIYWDKE